MNRIPQTSRAPVSGARRLGAGFLAAALALTGVAGSAFAQENPDPSLQGVSRSQIEANGLPATVTTSARGLNENGAPQIPRSGCDFINNGTTGVVLLRGVPLLPNLGNCSGLTDDAFFLVTLAGRPGDADGDGVFNTNAGPCASHRGNNPAAPKIIDGNVGDVGILTFGEQVRLRLDRNCDGKADLVLSLTNDPSSPTTLRVESDDFTGHAGENLGGRGTNWEASTFPGVAYPQPCPDPSTITGYYILRIPNFSAFFSAAGLFPGSFGFIVSGGSDDDGVEEDLIAGEVHTAEPNFSMTKTPDLALCPGEEGDWTIHLANTGNTRISNLVVTDVLPAGVTFVSVVSGGVTASGTSTLTFSAFDLDVCASKDIVFRVRANQDCVGSGVNSATGLGTYPTFCDAFTPGQLSDVLVSVGPVFANFTCKANCGGEACPRTPGFWMAQCAQRLNGSTKFSADQVKSIAECIDDRSAFFDWPPNTDLDLFCRNINPPRPMDQRKQAKRQFAAMLANFCTDFLNLQPSHGGTIFLDPNTPVHCDGLASTTIGALIDEVDALLASLEGQGLNDPAVKAKYGAIISCLDAINNGVSIPTAPGCEETSGSSSDDAAEVDGSSSVELYRPMPNPFSDLTSFAYAVSDEGSAAVDIAVYDVAGRLVRKLESGMRTPGVHTVTWDGMDSAGTRMARGVYLVKAVIGGKVRTRSVIYLAR